MSESDDARERQFWLAVLRVLGTSSILLVALGVLLSLTLLLGWQRYLLLCLMGALAGLAILVAIQGAARTREVTSLVLGAVTLPGLAAYLAGLAAHDEATFTAYSAGLFPFFVHASVVIIAGLWILRAWRRTPGPAGGGGAEEDVRQPSEGAVP